MKRLLLASWCVFLISCSDSHRGHPAHYVTGKILINGKPASGAQIVLIPVEDWGSQRVNPAADTKPDGSFVLTTYREDDGAPVGEYKVRIGWYKRTRRGDYGEDRLKGKYINPNASGLKATIEKSTRELPPFDLTADLKEDNNEASPGSNQAMDMPKKNPSAETGKTDKTEAPKAEQK
jgi:hypothetical protein